MTPRSRLRLLFAALLAAMLSVALVAPAEAKPRHDYPNRIELPVGFLPEGITIGKAPVAYLGSRADGDIYAADLRTGQGRVISQGPGTASVGLKIDSRGLLYVAGGPSGTARVVNTRTGNYRQLHPDHLAQLHQRRGADQAGRLVHQLAAAGALPPVAGVADRDDVAPVG